MVSFRSRQHGRGAVLWALIGLVALCLLAPSANGEMASNVLLPLPDVAIPPAQGKTLSSDIMEIDQKAHLLYLADRTSAGVDVFDIRTPSAKYVKTIPTQDPPNGVMLAKNVNKVYVGLGANSPAVPGGVGVIDIDPGSAHQDTMIAKISTGGKKRADEGDYDPVDKKLYIASSDDGLIQVVDATTDKIIKTWKDMGEGLEQPRYNPADGMMYMTSSDQNLLFQFDPKKDVLVKKFPVGVLCDPNGLAINPRTNQALLGCSDKKANQTVIWDLKAGKVATLIPQIWAGDGATYSAKENLFFFAAANQPNGAQLGVITGGPSVRYAGGAATYVGSHTLAYDETNRVIYTQDQRPNSARLFAFFLAVVPK
jgi:DNA-binding beta-propeller fold protein YncE